MKKKLRILTLNFGSTSSRIAIYEDGDCIENIHIQHEDTLLEMPLFPQQCNLRKQAIVEFLKKREIKINGIDAISARGGRIKPVKSGVYKINENMVSDAKNGLQGEHPANLAVVIAWELSKKYSLLAFTVDPISVDEMDDIARITGIKGIKRNCLSHALNMKAVAKKFAKDKGKSYQDCNLIVVHLGGGGSVSAHKKGKMVDVYNSDKEGPFAIERAGNLPTLDLIDFISTERLSSKEISDLITHYGGFYSYFESRNLSYLEKLYYNDEKAKLILEAYVYNISKYICSFLPIFIGEIDAVILTGGVCHSKLIKELITEKISFLGEIVWYPGEFEMESLAQNVILAIQGKIPIYKY
jgi:butyrate kinase